MLKIRDLSKTYANGVQALKGIPLDIPTGMFGLLGPNGADTSTPMRTLATLHTADSGSVHLCDLYVLADQTKAPRRLAVQPTEFRDYHNDPAVDTLHRLAN